MSDPSRLYGKSPRSSPPGDAGGSFFHTGQGGRTVLPPLSTAFPTSLFPAPGSYAGQYPSQRSQPSRYDYPGGTYPQQWSSGQNPSYPYYESQEPRYASQLGYGHGHGQPDSRKLPPLGMSGSYGRGETMPSYHPMSSEHVRSPTTSYPDAYGAYPSGSGSYGSYEYGPPDPRHPQNPLMHPSSHSMPPGMSDPRSGTPYGRSPGFAPPRSNSPPPVSPIGPEEPTVKKKRKRADANQLKILTETYNRTAFPSTEERLELAKRLDMTPRSVQIWFQNRRQSMRQTRQPTSAHQSFALGQSEALADDLQASGAVSDVPLDPYMPRHASPPLTSQHRRPRSQDDHSKPWGHGY